MITLFMCLIRALEKDPQLSAKIEGIKREATRKGLDQKQPTDTESKETNNCPPFSSLIHCLRRHESCQLCLLLDQHLLPHQQRHLGFRISHAHF
ncbi:hypothetical protein V1523DRAFT_420280 [Lipomyces doorenjongii]